MQVTTVGVAKVARQDLSQDLVIAAEFHPFQEIDVHAKIAGYVKKIYVDVGDRVRTGQLLAVLEVPELQDDIAQTDASVKRSEEQIKQAQGELERAQSAHELADLSYTRLAKVVKTRPNLIAQQDIDDAQGKDRVSDAQVASAKAALAASQEELEIAKANRQKVETLFAYARISAPFNGVITKRFADTGVMVQAGTASQTQAMPLVRLSQNDLLRLIIPVPESVVPRIRVGTPAEIRVPVSGKTFHGTVARFAGRVDFATRTMDTEIDVPNPRLELVPGMYANASIRLDQKRDILTVPVQALNRDAHQITVLRVNTQGIIEERTITIGLETPTKVEVLSGLQENDSVVVGGRSQLRPGEKVQPKLIDLSPIAGES